MTDTSPAVAKLQQSGTPSPILTMQEPSTPSIRLAPTFANTGKALNCSPSLLRHPLQALQAPVEHRFLAHKGELSTNQPVRRAKAAGTRRAVKQSKVVER